jgi:hypothetical protein
LRTALEAHRSCQGEFAGRVVDGIAGLPLAARQLTDAMPVAAAAIEILEQEVPTEPVGHRRIRLLMALDAAAGLAGATPRGAGARTVSLCPAGRRRPSLRARPFPARRPHRPPHS